MYTLFAHVYKFTCTSLYAKVFSVAENLSSSVTGNSTPDEKSPSLCFCSILPLLCGLYHKYCTNVNLYRHRVYYVCSLYYASLHTSIVLSLPSLLFQRIPLLYYYFQYTLYYYFHTYITARPYLMLMPVSLLYKYLY